MSCSKAFPKAASEEALGETQIPRQFRVISAGTWNRNEKAQGTVVQVCEVPLGYQQKTYRNLVAPDAIPVAHYRHQEPGARRLLFRIGQVPCPYTRRDFPIFILGENVLGKQFSRAGVRAVLNNAVTLGASQTGFNQLFPGGTI